MPFGKGLARTLKGSEGKGEREERERIFSIQNHQFSIIHVRVLARPSADGFAPFG